MVCIDVLYCFLLYRQAFKLRQTEEQQKLVEMRRQKEEEMLQKRQEYVEKTKNAVMFGEMPSDKSSKKSKRGRSEQYVSDSGSDAERADENAPPGERKKKRKEGGDRKSKGRVKRKKDRSGDSGGKIQI